MSTSSPHILYILSDEHRGQAISHQRSQCKSHPHEESVRIPAIFHRPGVIPAQGAIDGLFSLVDMMATTLSLAEQPIPPWNQGTDFAPAILGRPFDGPEDVLLDADCPDWRGLVTRQHKYAFYENGFELLFDLDADPYEQHNLAQDQPALCLQMRQRLLKHLARTREPFFDVIMTHGVSTSQPVRHVGEETYPVFHYEWDEPTSPPVAAASAVPIVR